MCCVVLLRGCDFVSCAVVLLFFFMFCCRNERQRATEMPWRSTPSLSSRGEVTIRLPFTRVPGNIVVAMVMVNDADAVSLLVGCLTMSRRLVVLVLFLDY